MTRVLLIGKDARTDCISEALSAAQAKLYTLTEFVSPGLRRRSVELCPARTDNPKAVLEFAKKVKPDLVVIGPEEPLAAGVVDVLQRELHVPCFGPTKSLARLESSKSFTRELVGKYGIPGNPEHRIFSTLAGVEDYLRWLGDFVIKPDGLTGGKGVKVSGDHLASITDGVRYVQEILASGGPVVIEEKLEGEEFSFHSICDGETVVHTVPVQDHKRAWNDDRGPNTGGMGSYSSADHSLPFLGPEHLVAARRINELVAAALREETGEGYRGVLYGGFMATADGVRLIEYNARFGDPEAMNIIPLLKTNFLDLCMGVAQGHLRDVRVEFRRQASVCKYLVPKGYPNSKEKGVEVLIPTGEPWKQFGAHLYYAAVTESENGVLLTGSRALAFVGIGASIGEAAAIAERALQLVQGPLEHRSDIGSVALLQRRVDHMQRLQQRQAPREVRSRATA